jgi:hypothetical protein
MRVLQMMPRKYIRKDPKADQYVKDKKNKTGNLQNPPALSR